MIKKIFPLFILVAVALFSFTWNSNPSPLQLGIDKEVTENELTTTGQFPDWLEGVLVRNSAIPIYQDGKQISHDFDGLAMLHGFAFDKGKVLYTNRFLKSKAYNTVVNQGSANFYGFNAQPTLWQRFLDFFTREEEGVKNASVNVFKYGDQHVALTETPLPACFNLTTLETLGSFDFQDALPKNDIWESAHPHLHPDTHEIVNYLIEFGPQCYYVIYRMQEGSSAREVIARVPVDMPAYMHSFAVTEHYCIFTEFPWVVNPLDLLFGNKPFIQNFTWIPERGVRFLVIEKSSGVVVSQALTEPFFSFHHANAYEEEHGSKLMIDVITYPDPETAFESVAQAKLMRYHLSMDNHEITPETLLEKQVEFPRLDDQRDGKPYRYLYMTLSENGSHGSHGIVKYDLLQKELKSWHHDGCYAVEPVYIPAPNRTEEDEGILLTVVHNKNTNDSFLLALDAQSLAEIARATLPWAIPGSLHGQYFAESTFLNLK